MCIAVYVQSGSFDVRRAVQDHYLLLKTLSRSRDVRLVETAPADDCVSVPADSDTTLHLAVSVSGALF